MVVQPENCHILRLPPELRVYTYQYVLDRTRLSLKLNGGARFRALALGRNLRSDRPLQLSLFQTCKLINTEAEVMIWSRVPVIVSRLATISELAIRTQRSSSSNTASSGSSAYSTYSESCPWRSSSISRGSNFTPLPTSTEC